MSTAFWVLQGLFLVAVIVTALRAARGRPAAESSAPAPPRPAQEPAETERAHFAPRELARLLILRGLVQDAKSGQGELQDDLAADRGEVWVVPKRPPERPVPTGRAFVRSTVITAAARQAKLTVFAGARPRESDETAAPRRSRFARGQWTLIVGVVLLVVGLAGATHTSVAMDTLQRATHPLGGPGISLMARLAPGLLANPAKYLAAVNSGQPSAGSMQDALDAMARVQLKQAMDRWEALIGLGLAMVLAMLLATTRSRPAPASASDVGSPQTAVAADFIPFLLVAALVCASFSFFEIP